MASILILGCSDIFLRRVLPALDNIDACTDIYVASKSKSVDLRNESQKIRIFYTDYDQALSKTDADWVYISTINSEHERLAIKSISYCKNTIVDKPAALTESGAEKLITAARSAGVNIIEAALFQFHPQVELIKHTFNSSKLTRIVSLFTIPPLQKDNFRNHRDLGGGAILDMGAYVFGLGRLVWNSEPISISAKKMNADGDLIKSFSVLLDYGEGRSLVGHFGFDAHYTNRATFFGPDQLVDIDRIFTIPGDLENKITIRNGCECEELICARSDPFENFFSLVLKGDLDFSSMKDNLLSNSRGISALTEQMK